MGSSLVPQGLDLSIAKDTAMAAMQILVFCINRTQFIKKGTKFSTKVIPVGLDFLVAKDTAMVTIEIFEISCKIVSIKKH